MEWREIDHIPLGPILYEGYVTVVSPRGLATLALLRTRFDEGRDHLGLFEPFVEDALRHCLVDNFVAGDIKALLEARSGLVVPASTVNALLGRFARAGFLTRAGGRFLRTQKQFEGHGIEDGLAQHTAEMDKLGVTLSSFAAEHGKALSPTDALAALTVFVSENKVPLVLGDELEGGQISAETLPLRLARLVARFVTQRCVATPDLQRPLESLIEGMVLRDTLLLSDLADVGARFRNLTVAIDTPILLALLDLTGVANGIAAREFLGLLRDTGAVVIAFTPTIAEIRGILLAYERNLATAAGRLALYPSDLTQHVFSARLTPADMRTASALVEQRLSQMGVTIRETPARDRRYTLDEEALANALVFQIDPDPDRPRIRHDVNCIAAILTIRANRTSSSLERSWAVFCTTTTRVVRNVQKWYETQDIGGIPPIVHQIALSNIAWLKRPATARRVKLHELLAQCATVLKPRKATWDKFIHTLRKLREEGNLQDDETVAIVANELTEPMLAQLDDDHEPEADTILDAIERVRHADKERAEQAAAAVVRQAHAETELARQHASDVQGRNEEITGAIERRVERLAGLLAGVGYFLVLGILLASVILALPGIEVAGGSAKYVARALVLLAGLFGVYTAVRGTSLNEYRRKIHISAAHLIRRNLFGTDNVSGPGANGSRQ